MKIVSCASETADSHSGCLTTMKVGMGPIEFKLYFKQLAHERNKSIQNLLARARSISEPNNGQNIF